jgi:putative ABC transport system permease protein
MWRDLRYGFHTLWRTPGVTVAVTLSLGLAIGANATIFGAVEGLWLRPPGVSDPGALVRVFSTSESGQEGLWSFPEYRELRDANQSFSGVAARGRRGTNLQLPDGTSELQLVNVVSLNFFSVLGVSAAHGRLFGPDDAHALERSPAVVLGHDAWRRRFGSDPSIAGRTITIGRRPLTVTVLGVLPERFRDLEAAADRDLWIPPQTWALLNGQQEFEQRDFRWFDIIARRRPGVDVAQASAEVETFSARLAMAYPPSNRGRGGRAISELSHRLETGGVNAFALLALVMLVAVITCVNVANLQLARAAARLREFAVRTALGASRARLVRQLMAEHLLLGALGAVAGLLIAAWIIRLLPAIIGAPPGLRAFTVFALDDRVAVFTLSVTLVTTIAFGLVPSWLASRPDIVPLLKGDSGSAPARHRFTRETLVTLQIATAVVLLTASALFARSFAASSTLPLGFARKPVLTAWVLADMARPTGDSITERLGAIPGVRNVAVALRAPLSLSGSGMSRTLVPEGADPQDGRVEVKYNAISTNYFETMGIRLLDGRAFTESDQRGDTKVIVVSAWFAKRFFPGTSALDRLVRIEPGAVEHRIVGVVDDVVIGAVNEEREAYFYLPFWPGGYPETTFLVETGTDATAVAPTVRETLRSMDPRFDPRIVASMDELIAYSARNYRWTALLAATLGILGLLLTAIGVYGVISFNTMRRTREIGIRLALGARRGQVLGLVLRDGSRLALIGVAIGLPAALVAARLVSSLLFGVHPGDLLSFASAAAIVVLIVIFATLVPARRALAVQPSAALRTQ